MKINRDNTLFSSILSTISFLIALLILISLCACNDVSEDTTPTQPIEEAIDHIEVIADDVVETYDAEDYDYESLPEEYNSNSSRYLYDTYYIDTLNMVDELVAESEKKIAESEKMIEETNRIIEEANQFVDSYNINFSAYGF